MSRRALRALAVTFAAALASVPATLLDLHGPSVLLRLVAVGAFLVVLREIALDRERDDLTA